MVPCTITGPICQNNVSSVFFKKKKKKKSFQDSGHIKQIVLCFLTRDILIVEKSLVVFVFILDHNSFISFSPMIFIFFPAKALRKNTMVKYFFIVKVLFSLI